MSLNIKAILEYRYKIIFTSLEEQTNKNTKINLLNLTCNQKKFCLKFFLKIRLFLKQEKDRLCFIRMENYIFLEVFQDQVSSKIYLVLTICGNSMYKLKFDQKFLKQNKLFLQEPTMPSVQREIM